MRVKAGLMEIGSPMDCSLLGTGRIGKDYGAAYGGRGIVEGVAQWTMAKALLKKG
jgi:hypothetical protein